jgi:hypothetical protein
MGRPSDQPSDEIIEEPVRRKRGYRINPREPKPARIRRLKFDVKPDADGNINELAFLQAVINHPDADVRLKVGASIGKLRYTHTPAQRYVPEALGISVPITVIGAAEAMAKVSELVLQKKLSIEQGNDLQIQIERVIEVLKTTELAARIEKLEAMFETNPPPPPPTEVVDGLPALPGTDIIWPSHVKIVRTDVDKDPPL